MINPITIVGNTSVVIKLVCTLLKKRVDYKCQDCGRKARKRLEVHHKDHCGLNWNIENLVVLCTHCHGQRFEDHKLGVNNESILAPLEYPQPTLATLKKEYINYFPRA